MPKAAKEQQACRERRPGFTFTDPDAVIVIVDDLAGIAMWTREDLARHRLLRPN